MAQRWYYYKDTVSDDKQSLDILHCLTNVLTTKEVTAREDIGIEEGIASTYEGGSLALVRKFS